MSTLSLLLKIIYYIVLLLCAILAIGSSFTSKWHRIPYFGLYFGFVLSIEVLANIFKHILHLPVGLIYNFYPILSLIYFAYLFSVEEKQQKHHIFHKGLFLISLCSMVWIFLSNALTSFSQINAFIYATFLILHCLNWFYKSIKFPDDILLHHKPIFWICAGNLFWSVFFYFRCIPMYYLEHHDYSFLVLLQYIYNATNIVLYLLFIFGMLWKKSPTN